jgi:AcrR family transcriptional regulator
MSAPESAEESAKVDGAMAATTRKRLPRAEREERMLDAAEAVFGKHGFQAASMDEIARRSGITKALLYQYFGSKEGLYEACVERGRADLFEVLREAVTAAAPGRPQLAAFVNGYFDFVEKNRGVWWLLYGEASSSAVNAMRQRNAELIADLFQRALEEQSRKPDPEALAVLAHHLVGAGEQVGRWWADRSDVPKQTVVDTFLELAGGAIDAVFRTAPRRR